MIELFRYFLKVSDEARELRRALAKIDPSGFEGAAFVAILASEDPQRKKLESCLQDRGYSPHALGARWNDASEYLVEIRRIYDAADLGAAAFLQLLSNTPLEPAEPRRQENGMAPVRPSRIRGKNNAIIHQAHGVALVSNDIREKLETQSFRGIHFRESTVCIKLGPPARFQTWDEYRKPPWWELASSIVLPPVSPSMTLVKMGEKPVTRGSAEPCAFREGRFVIPELHYRRSDLCAFPAFDLAFTFERHGSVPPYERHLIASQRFYRFCIDHNIKCDWIPVRIDDE
jgi:hypothetical protein